MRIRTMFLSFASTGLLAMPAVAVADDTQMQLQQMQQRMSQMEDRLQATTDQLEATQQRATDQQELIEKAGLARDSSASGIAAFLETLEIGGHVSTSYNYNFNRPHKGLSSGTGNLGGNGLRAFDTDSNGFALDQLKIQLERPVSQDARAGFRGDIYFGKTARILNSITDGALASDANGVGDGNEVHLSQAYAQYLIPNVDIKLQAGLFQTIMGAEVIDSPANYNISRSLLFANAIPYEHLGILATKKYESGIDWGIGLVNGWDPSTGPDLNNNKGLLARLGYGQDMWALGVNGYYGGNETVNDESNQRGLVDIVLNLKPIDSFSMYFNADFGWQQYNTSGAVVRQPDDFWYGFAMAGRYAVTDRLGVSLRGEWMRDIESTFFNPNGAGVLGERSSVYEITGTVDYALTQNLIARAEFRHDRGQLENTSDRLFRGDSDTSSNSMQKNQQTLAAELIYKF